MDLVTNTIVNKHFQQNIKLWGKQVEPLHQTANATYVITLFKYIFLWMKS